MKSNRSVVRVALAAGSAALAAPAGIAAATTEPPAETAPASTAATAPAADTVSDHAQVIAQGVIDFPAGQFAWTPTQDQVDAAGTQVDPQGSQFILADSGHVLVSSGDGRRSLLAPGEATFDPRSLPATLNTAGGASAGYWSILLMAGEFEAGPTVIEPGVGARDVDLVRDVLAPGESLTVPSSLPEFVLVTAGSVTTDEDLVVDAGASTTIASGTALTNAGADSATVVVVAIGDLVGAAPETPATTTAPTTAAPTTAAPSGSDTTAPNNTEPVAPPDQDPDNDGLSTQDEIVIGTDAAVADTDGDGVDDGTEVNVGNTDPLDPNDFSAG